MAQIGSDAIGGDKLANVYKLEMKSSWYFKGFGEGHVLEVNGRTGVAENYGDNNHVPLFDRWFLGGIYSLRGYRYPEVGPRDSKGQPIGGQTYWLGSAEYSIPVITFMRLAAFYDIGMVYRDPYHYNFANYNDNWGVGVRLNIPRLGPLRLDYGIPITSDGKNGRSGRFQFSAGYTRDF